MPQPIFTRISPILITLIGSMLITSCEHTSMPVQASSTNGSATEAWEAQSSHRTDEFVGNATSEVGLKGCEYGIAERVPWTTSRVRGSPEPPRPYRTENAFPRLKFKNPTVIANAPGTDRLFVAEQAAKLYSFSNDPNCDHAEMFLDIPKETRTIDAAGPAKTVGDCYGLTFHPEFEKNRYCYVCYIVNGADPNQPLQDGTRVSRFRVTETDPPRCDPASEEIIITWLAGGHNGGCLAFGPVGYLYIWTCDAMVPMPPDGLDGGQ